jgi:hypothetical protein
MSAYVNRELVAVAMHLLPTEETGIDALYRFLNGTTPDDILSEIQQRKPTGPTTFSINLGIALLRSVSKDISPLEVHQAHLCIPEVRRVYVEDPQTTDAGYPASLPRTGESRPYFVKRQLLAIMQDNCGKEQTRMGDAELERDMALTDEEVAAATRHWGDGSPDRMKTIAKAILDARNRTRVPVKRVD